MTAVPCTTCSNAFDMPAERCPHCAEPGLFSNVWAAKQQDNADKLDRRFQAALRPPGNTADDQFVEAHIWGPMTIRTVE